MSFSPPPPQASIDLITSNKEEDTSKSSSTNLNKTTAKASPQGEAFVMNGKLRRRTLLFECRGDHNVFGENLPACHVVVRFDTRVTFIKMGHVDNVRVANYASLPASNIGAPTPTGEMDVFALAADERAAMTYIPRSRIG